MNMESNHSENRYQTYLAEIEFSNPNEGTLGFWRGMAEM